MNIHGKFLTFAEDALIEWAVSNLHQYREADNREEFCQETYDEFVEQTFNSDHEHWYSNPRSLTFDDIQALLSTHADHCQHQKEHVDYIVPPPDCIHDLLVNFGYYNATVGNQERLHAKLVQAFQELDVAHPSEAAIQAHVTAHLGW